MNREKKTKKRIKRLERKKSTGNVTVNATTGGSSGGVTSFLELSDVPSTYSGQAGKSVVVNGTEDALEFTTASGGGHTIQDEGTPITQRTNLNFVGSAVTVTDDAGNDATKVTISSGGSGTVNSGTQYRIAYYATTGTAVSEASAITASRALKSDANGVPTHFDTTTEPSLTELTYVKGVSSAIQTQLNGKQASITASDTQVLFSDGANNPAGDAGMTYNKTTNVLTTDGHVLNGETASRVAIIDASKNIKSADTATYPSLTELAYVKGVTSAIQTQLNNLVTGDYGLESAVFDGQGSVVLVNTIKYFRARKAGTITAWSIIAEGTSPTCTIDIFKIATGTTLPTSSICAAALPALSTGNALKSTTLTGWTTSYSADDMFAVKITSCANATKITFDIYS